MRSCRKKTLEPELQSLRIRSLLGARRRRDALAVEILQSLTEHRPVVLLEDTRGDVDPAARIDSEHVAIVGEVVNRAEREPVTDDRRTAFVHILDDVSCLNEGSLP